MFDVYILGSFRSVESASEVDFGTGIILAVLAENRHINHIDKNTSSSRTRRVVGPSAFFRRALKAGAFFRSAKDALEIDAGLRDSVDIRDNFLLNGRVPAEKCLGCVDSAQPKQYARLSATRLTKQAKCDDHDNSCKPCNVEDK